LEGFELLGEFLDRRIGAGAAAGVFRTRGARRAGERQGQQHDSRNANASTLNNRGQ
jgi:hypothetical protein